MVYTANDLRHIASIKVSDPYRKNADLPSGKRFAYMERVTLVAGKPCYLGKLMLSLDDDKVVLQEVKQHLKVTGSEATAKKFIEERYAINWFEFTKRNRAEIDTAMGRQHSEPLLDDEQVAIGTECLDQHPETHAALAVPADGKENDQTATPNLQRTIVAEPTAAFLATAVGPLVPIQSVFKKVTKRKPHSL